MQLSYSVIKKSCINSNSVYTVQAPLIQLKQEVLDTDEYPAGSLEDINDRAEVMILDAEARKTDILKSAVEEAERIKKDAYEMAFKRGYLEGVKKGQEDGFNRTEAIRRDAEDVLHEAHRVSREYIDKQKDEITDLALTIAEKIIGYQADVNDSIITGIVSSAIGCAVVKEQIVIRVNPMDYALLDCRMDEILKAAGYDRAVVNIVRDNEIKRGGCSIDTGISSVDAQIDSQLLKIKEALMG